MMNIIDKVKYITKEMQVNASRIHRSKLFTYTDMIWCGIRYGASPSNYYNFDFCNATSRERNTFITHRISEKIMNKFNAPNAIGILYNKGMFAERFGEYWGGRSWEVSSSMTFAAFDDLVSKESKIICKPILGGQGRGIHVFEVTELNKQKVFEEIRGMPECIVENWIHQHEKMNELYSKSVNPIRIQTILKDGKVQCIAATLTVGNGAQYANASSKAIFALVDIEDGIVCSDGYDYDCHIYYAHPETGIKFRGFSIPYWEETLKLVKNAAFRIPEVGYIGWDVAISENGPCLIEGNSDPGYTAYQLPVLTGKHEGIYNLYKPFL